MTDLAVPHLRTSERRDFKRCQWRWQQTWRKGLKLKYPKADALWFGIGIHLALQERYKYRGVKRGKNVLKVWRDYCADEQAVIFGDNFENDRDDYTDATQLGEAMLGAYLDKYGIDEKWFVISAEQTFEVPIPRPTSKALAVAGAPLVFYNGTFDLVALNQETDNSLWVWDHKSAKAIQTTHLSLDDQAGSYWAIAGDVLRAQRLISPGMTLDGILYNFLRKAKPDTRPINADGKPTNKPVKANYIDALAEVGVVATSKQTLPELSAHAESYGLTVFGDESKVPVTPNFLREEVWRTRAERRTQIQKIQAEALQMEAIRTGVLPITKNPTKDCAWDCHLFQMCELHELGTADWREFRDLAYRKEDPYADHRKSANAE